MLSTIANLMSNNLSNLIFISKLSGLVYPVKIKSGDKTKTVPVSNSIALNTCDSGSDKIMIPDKKQTCIIYFEDNGVLAKGNNSRYIDFEASLRIVAWCNLALIGLPDTTLLIANILKNIPFQLPNTDIIVKISTLFIGEEPKTQSIFSKYDYDEKVNFLNKPYDYFALNYKVKFSIPLSCVGSITLKSTQC